MKPTELRFWWSVWLLAGLAGCSVFHPHRIPNPKTPPEIIAQRKAKAKAAKEGAKKQKEKANAVESDGTATEEALSVAANDDAAPADSASRRPPEQKRSKVRYDKHQLLKKPKYRRRRLHQVPQFTVGQRISNFFQFLFRAKPDYNHKPGAKPAEKTDAAPANDEPLASPDDAPTAP